MSEHTWTKDEMEEFTELVDMASSQHQMSRLHSRFEMPKFIEKHGKPKCDAMFAELTKDDGKPAKKRAKR